MSPRETHVRDHIANRAHAIKWAAIERGKGHPQAAAAWLYVVAEEERSLRRLWDELDRDSDVELRIAGMCTRSEDEERHLAAVDEMGDTIDLIQAALAGDGDGRNEGDQGDQDGDQDHLPSPGREARGSYPSGLVKELVVRKIADDPQHAISVLNLSGGLAEGWTDDELLVWATDYRRCRDAGFTKATAVTCAAVFSVP